MSTTVLEPPFPLQNVGPPWASQELQESHGPARSKSSEKGAPDTPPSLDVSPQPHKNHLGPQVGKQALRGWGFEPQAPPRPLLLLKSPGAPPAASLGRPSGQSTPMVPLASPFPPERPNDPTQKPRGLWVPSLAPPPGKPRAGASGTENSSRPRGSHRETSKRCPFSSWPIKRRVAIYSSLPANSLALLLSQTCFPNTNALI